MPKVAVIVAAGGKGERFGDKQSKVMAHLDGRPIFLRSLEQFINRDDVIQTILVASPEDSGEIKSRYGANLGFMGVKLAEGGATRVESVAKGLEVVRDDADLVAIHDAVRPCVTESMISDVFAEAQKSGAAILACPIQGTIKRVSEAGVVDATVPRERLFEAQTPQVFRRDLIVKAHAERPEDLSQITDDAQLVELLGHPVSVVTCDATNLKITTKADITLANAIIKSRPAKAAPRMGAFDEAQW